MTTTLNLERLPGRCPNGFAAIQHPRFCECADLSEWAIFSAAVKAAARDGLVHQSAVRPLIRGRIKPKHVGQLYRKARTTGLLVDTQEREPSNDTAGRNTDKLDRIYKLGAAA